VSADSDVVSINFEGTQIASKYDVGALIGSGSTSLVYDAKRKADGVEVAIKVVSQATAPHVSSTLWKEAGKKMADCAGKNVVALLEEIEENGQLFLVLEKYEGPFIKLLWKQKAEWSEKKAASLIGQLLRAVRRVHKKKIVHGDVSPGNILSRGEVTEIALGGFAKAVRGPTTHEVSCSSYLKAPELLAKQNHSKKIDIWAIGCITYLLLCGRWPFFDSNRMKQNLLIQEAKVDFSDKAWEKISASAKEFIKVLLVADPGKRLKASVALEQPWLKETQDGVIPGIHDVWAKTLDFK
jgi:calcium/calmodulin-dependent protein kinase I